MNEENVLIPNGTEEAPEGYYSVNRFCYNCNFDMRRFVKFGLLVDSQELTCEICGAKRPVIKIYQNS